MSSSLRSFRFGVLTLAAALTFAGTLALGQWQLRRAAQKEAVQAELDSKSILSPLTNVALAGLAKPEDDLYRHAVLQGVWQPKYTVYLDNRSMEGHTGFWVMTPLALQGSGQIILVQRGWIPRDFVVRTRLPAVETPLGVVTVAGRIALPPAKLYEFKGADTGMIRQNLDIGEFRLETGLPLMDVSLVELGAPSQGLRREWAPPSLGLEKHYGYAFQWFGLAALVLGLYVWFQLISPIRRRYRPSSGAHESD